jgi:hypothetical protein
MRGSRNSGLAPNRAPLVEGEDFYFENRLMVLTEKFLLDRGYCCENGCRHCPYQSDPKAETLQVRSK